MILKNKLTRETLEISYPEFRKKFAKEIRIAFESYRRTQLNKYSYNFKDDNSMEYNFYFQLHWNFNHFGNSNWYIERIWRNIDNKFKLIDKCQNQDITFMFYFLVFRETMIRILYSHFANTQIGNYLV